MFDFCDNMYEDHFFLNNGSGYFSIGDIDSDDDIDVIFYSNPFFFWGYITNSGLGQYVNPEYYNLDYPPSGIACGDLNGDEREDIVVSGGAYLDSWINYATGLQYINICDSAYVSGVNVADIDLDGNNDLIATRWGMAGVAKRFFIYSNDGIGNFTRIYDRWIDEAMSKLFISDLNNDNYPDVIYNVSYSYPNSNYELFHTYILFNNQDNTFADPVNYYTGICSHKSYAADLDGNGWNDIITLNYDFYNPPPDTGSIHILFNDGTGNFVEDPQVGTDEEFIINNNECKLTNYPNPFNPKTTISYNLPINLSSPVIEIFNIKGHRIRRYSISNFNSSIIWDGMDKHQNQVSSGVYLYRIKSDEGVLVSKKMLLLK
ncbi:T9SS type A sorting domain-containing protein [Candidatus Cloacimonadota bacterium]